MGRASSENTFLDRAADAEMLASKAASTATKSAWLKIAADYRKMAQGAQHPTSAKQPLNNKC